MEGSDDGDGDAIISPKSNKKRRLPSSDESDDERINTPSRQNTRSSARIRTKNQRSFTMPSRDKVFSAIPDLESPGKGINSLKPRKLVNDFTRVSHRYNYDPDYTDSEESIEDFIVEDNGSHKKSPKKKKGMRRGRVMNFSKLHQPSRIQQLPSSSSGSDSETPGTCSHPAPAPMLSKSSDASPSASAPKQTETKSLAKSRGRGKGTKGTAGLEERAAAPAEGWRSAGRLRNRNAPKSANQREGRGVKAELSPLKASAAKPLESVEKGRESESESDEDIVQRKVRRPTELDSEDSSDEEEEAESKSLDVTPGEKGDCGKSESGEVSSGNSSKIEEFSSSEESEPVLNKMGRPARKVITNREYERSRKFADLKTLRMERERKLSCSDKKKDSPK